MHPNQSGEGGSIPTPPLHVVRAPLGATREIIERVHYTHSCFGVTCSAAFVVEHDDRTVGAAIFGRPAAYNVARKYGEPLLELRRFVLEDWLPKNSESRVLAVMLRALKRDWVGRILSYADPAFGHRGTIYAACGFKQVGLTAKRRHLLWKGKKYPDRNLHQTRFPFHLELRAAHPGWFC